MIVTPTLLFRGQTTPQDCSQAEQARQSASEGTQQALKSASDSMRQIYNSASQLIAAASGSSSSVESSASSAISSIQASASWAVARAVEQMQSAQFTASNKEAQESQNATITATQAAVAIVESIIASTNYAGLEDKKEDRVEPIVNNRRESAWTDDVRSTIPHEEPPLRP
ncbi:predicted protein [Sclerotinia sclerotiorum 1980 UF-70]|uniref:Uncharacterized protein n=1 Tax=Sclerotinia sclerotiorum (strain ATCC 18683 / 1980 / Ss-1) TaxID=665079 RepID=A7ELZ1_SCLS1|nr:predicted protein [Sclerotinia sclerotiorum 1980 UF-70]EDO03857.1 predicted protein [Sclerotinia sclerotiorum 1980 UF-70]